MHKSADLIRANYRTVPAAAIVALGTVPLTLPEEFFGRPRVREHTDHAVISFMASGLVDLVGLIRLFFPRDYKRPRTHPCGRIFDGYRVFQPIFAYAFEPFDQVQVLMRALKVSLMREVRDVDHQRVALPPAARIPLPEPDARRQVLAAVDRNRADETRPLPPVNRDADLPRRLHDPIVGVELRQSAGQTPLHQRTIFRT